MDKASINATIFLPHTVCQAAARGGYSVRRGELGAEGDARLVGQCPPCRGPVPQHPNQNSKTGLVTVTTFNHESGSPDQSVVMRQVESGVRLRISGVHGQAQACCPCSSSKEQGNSWGWNTVPKPKWWGSHWGASQLCPTQLFSQPSDPRLQQTWPWVQAATLLGKSAYWVSAGPWYHDPEISLLGQWYVNSGDMAPASVVEAL